MTVVGKIFCILAFLVSCMLFGALIYLYMVHVPYPKLIKQYEVERDALLASEQDYKTRYENAVAETKNSKVDTAPEIKSKDEKIRVLTADKEGLTKEIQELRKQTSEFNASVKSYEITLTQTMEEKNRLQEINRNLNVKVAKLESDSAQANQDKLTAQVALGTKTELLKQADERTKDLVKALMLAQKEQRTGSSTATGATLASLNKANPPPFSVEGKVQKVSDNNELVQINVGSDAGLEKGHTLYIFRYGSRPLYLGMIRLTTVEPNRSVGQMTGKAPSALQIGDAVASKIVN